MKLSALIDSTRQVRRRQYPTRKIGAFDFKYVPQSRQLFISCTAFPLDPSSRRSPYKLSIAFNAIGSSDTADSKHLLKYANPGTGTLERFLEQPTVNHTCRVRCQCPDFYFMWEYYDKSNKALIGRHIPYIRKTTTRPPRNPDHMPGLCKHQIQMIKFLMDNNIIKKNVKSYDYLTRPVRT
jgi:hypothetical protein